MSLEIIKERVLEAHKAGCNDVKKTLETLFPEVFEVPEITIGTYRSKKGVIFLFKDIDGDYRLLSKDGFESTPKGKDYFRPSRLEDIPFLQNILKDLNAVLLTTP